MTECRVPELIPVLGSQPAGDTSHKPGGRLPLLSSRTAVTLATLKRAATNHRNLKQKQTTLRYKLVLQMLGNTWTQLIPTGQQQLQIAKHCTKYTRTAIFWYQKFSSRPKTLTTLHIIPALSYFLRLRSSAVRVNDYRDLREEVDN